MPRMPLPPDLAGGPFRVRDALAQGIGEARLYSNVLSRPTHGVRSELAPASVTERARATAVGLPSDVAFSHLTAAAVLGLRLPRDPSIDDLLDVMREASASRIRRIGCRHHKGLEIRRVESTDGVQVVGACDTWCDLGEDLDLEGLIIVGDSIAQRLLSVEPMTSVLASRRRPTNADLLRRALTWIRVGSCSHMESRARVAFARAGLPEPELNAPIHDRDGGWICDGDFVWRAKKVLAEYQGKDHFTPRRGPKDIDRRGLAVENGWTYVEMSSADYYNRGKRHVLLTRLGTYLRCDVDSDASWRND